MSRDLDVAKLYRPLPKSLKKLQFNGLLGSGRFGTVLSARLPSASVTVAIKYMQDRHSKFAPLDTVDHEFRMQRRWAHLAPPLALEATYLCREQSRGASRLAAIVMERADRTLHRSTPDPEMLRSLRRVLRFLRRHEAVHGDLKGDNVAATRGELRCLDVSRSYDGALLRSKGCPTARVRAATFLGHVADVLQLWQSLSAPAFRRVCLAHLRGVLASRPALGLRVHRVLRSVTRLAPLLTRASQCSLLRRRARREQQTLRAASLRLGVPWCYL
jgi:hypothetical protein